MFARRLCTWTVAVTLTALSATRPVHANPSQEQTSTSTGDWKKLGLASGGIGLIFLGGAAAYASSASHKRDQAKGLPEIDKQLLQTGDEHAHTSVVLGVVGGTALVGGLLAYFLGGAESQTPHAVRVTPVLPAGAGSYSGFALSAEF